MKDSRNYNQSSYIKQKGNKPHTPSRGLFDLPDGSKKMQPKKQNIQGNRNGTPKKRSGLFDLPSGMGKKEQIQRQQKINEERQKERLGLTQKNEKQIFTPKGKSVFVDSTKAPLIVDKKNSAANLEINASKSATQTVSYYYHEIGYYIRPLFIYFFAVFVYVLLGALGKLNGIDLRIACIVVFAPILIIGGVFVNRHNSVPGFAILGLTNIIGGLIGHAGIIEKLPIILQRLVKLLNIPFFSYNTDGVKLDSVILIGSVVAILALIYIGSRFHRITYYVRGLRKNTEEDRKLEQNTLTQDNYINN